MPAMFTAFCHAFFGEAYKTLENVSACPPPLKPLN